jgi:hypothetical protein
MTEKQVPQFMCQRVELHGGRVIAIDVHAIQSGIIFLGSAKDYPNRARPLVPCIDPVPLDVLLPREPTERSYLLFIYRNRDCYGLVKLFGKRIPAGTNRLYTAVGGNEAGIRWDRTETWYWPGALPRSTSRRAWSMAENSSNSPFINPYPPACASQPYHLAHIAA